MGNAAIRLRLKTWTAIIQQDDGETIQLQYQKIKEAKLNNNQKKAIKDQLDDHKGQKHVLTFTVELISAGEKIHDFNGGTATIRIPFELPEGTKAEDYVVFYLNRNGEIERYETTYDGKYLIVQLKHFSEYAVIYEPDVTEVEPEEVASEAVAEPVSAVSETSEAQAPSGLQVSFWLILMVVALFCVIVLLFILRKRF